MVRFLRSFAGDEREVEAAVAAAGVAARAVGFSSLTAVTCGCADRNLIMRASFRCSSSRSLRVRNAYTKTAISVPVPFPSSRESVPSCRRCLAQLLQIVPLRVGVPWWQLYGLIVVSLAMRSSRGNAPTGTGQDKVLWRVWSSVPESEARFPCWRCRSRYYHPTIIAATSRRLSVCSYEAMMNGGERVFNVSRYLTCARDGSAGRCRARAGEA